MNSCNSQSSSNSGRTILLRRFRFLYFRFVDELKLQRSIAVELARDREEAVEGR